MADLAVLNIVVNSGNLGTVNRLLQQLSGASVNAAGGVGRLNRSFFSNTALVNGASQAYRGLFGLVAQTAGAVTLLGTALASLKLAAEFEQQTVAIQTLVGNVDRANQMLMELQDLAINTPLQFRGLTEVAKNMLALGFKTETVLPTMKALSNIVAAMGGTEQNMERIIVQLSQMSLKGRVATQDMRILAENGVNSFGYLRDAVGGTFGELFKLIERGRLDGGEAMKVIIAGINNDPKFKNLAKIMQESLRGTFNKVVEQITFALRDIGTEAAKAFDLKGALNKFYSGIVPVRLVLTDLIRLLAGLPPRLEASKRLFERLAPILQIVGTFLKIIIAIKVATFLLGIGGALLSTTVRFIAFAGVLNTGAKYLLNFKTIILGLPAAIKGAVVAFYPLIAVLAILSAAVLGFTLGSYLYDEFKIVQQAGALMVSAFQTMLSTIKFAFAAAKAGIIFIWESLWENMKSIVRKGLETLSAPLGVLDALIAYNTGLNSNLATLAKAATIGLGAGATGDPYLALGKSLDDAGNKFLEERALNLSVLATTMGNIAVEFAGKATKHGLENHLTGKSYWESVKAQFSGNFPDVLKLVKEQFGELSAVVSAEYAAFIKELDKPRGLRGVMANAVGGPMFVKMVDELQQASKEEQERAALAPDLSKLVRPKNEDSSINNIERRLQNLRTEIQLAGKSREAQERTLELYSFQDDALEAYGDDLIKVTQLTDEYAASLDKLNQLKKLEEIAFRVGDAFSDAFTDIIFSAKSATEAIGEFIKAVLKMVFQQAVAQPVASAVSTGIFGFLSRFGVGLFGGSAPTGSYRSPNVGFAAGQAVIDNAINLRPAVPFANGGVFSRSTAFPIGVMGERGPEAIMPLKRGANGRLGVEMNGGSSNNVVMNVYTKDADSFRRSKSQITGDLSRAVRKR